MNINNLIDTYNSSQLAIQIKDNIYQFQKSNLNQKIIITNKNNNLEFKEFDKSIEHIHFTNIIKKQNYNNINDIPELMDFIIKLNIYNYCIICHNILDSQSDIFIPCNKEDCLYNYKELIINSTVIEKFNDDPDKCIFLLESAFEAINCDRREDIFEPFPKHFLVNKVKNFELLKEVVNNLDINILLNIVPTYKTDKDLAEDIGKDEYILLRFILMSCNVDIVKNDDMLEIKGDKFIIYKIIHPNHKEEEFRDLIDKSDKRAEYMFHGSRYQNWYSILRNGLKNCSGTKLMTAGAAYGNGIYLSDNINISYSYGKTNHNNKSIIGVFELIDKPKYKKGEGIYVVNNEKVLIQRYLLILNNPKNLGEINKLFNKEIYKNKLDADIKYNKKSVTKILKEYRLLSRSSKKDGSNFRIQVDPKFPFEWKIFIGNLDKKLPIRQDMDKYKIKEIEMEIKFPENYPFSPPFMRVVRPRFMHLTGHITQNGGAICNELLTEKGWLPTCSIESLVIVVVSEIIEGDGRLDPNKYNVDYTLTEAKVDFVRVAQSHGWL
jgi:ubiquitin-protein ligase